MAIATIDATTFAVEAFPNANGRHGDTVGHASNGAVTPQAANWQGSIQQIEQLRTLAEDWDGQGATAPMPEVIDSAVQLALLYRSRQTPAPNRIVPGVGGTVIMEWQIADGYCEVEIVRPGYAEGMLVTEGRPPQHWTIPSKS